MAIGSLVAKLRIDSTQFDKNIKESTKQIKSIQAQGKKADAAIEKFAGGLLKAVPAFAAVGSASAAFNRTLEINQILGDDVRRAMDGAKGAMDSFFLSLSTGSFDGFFRKMGQTIEAAKELYNSLDNLATFRIYESADMAELNTQKTKYESILRNARSVDVNGNKIYSEEQIREAEKGLEEVNKKIKDTLLQERKLVDTAAQDIIQKVMAATGAGYGEAEKMLTDYRNAAEVQQRIAKLFAENTHEVRTATANQYGGTMTTTTTVWDNEAAKQEYQSLKALLALASDGQEVLGAYNQKRVEAAQIGQQILQNEANQIRLEGRANQAYKGSADAVDELNEKLNDNPLISADKTATNQIVTTLEQLPNKIAISSDFATPLDVLNSQLEQMRANAEAIGKAWDDNATAIGAIGGVVAEVGGLLDGNAAKITTWAASVIDSVGEVVAKYGALAAAKAAGEQPYPANLLAITTTISAILAAISAFPKFANGGIVGGTSWSGDKMTIGVNSGEMILNGVQQARLFSMINGGVGAGAQEVKFTIKGRDLEGVLNNYNSKFRQ